MNKINIFLLILITASIPAIAKEKLEHNVKFSIKQIATNSVNAFYLARGFTMEQIEPYADSCVYTTILRNDNKVDSIHYVRNNWVAQLQNVLSPVKTNTYWNEQFQEDNVSMSSWIAFRLAQMPEEQIYAANGDWNQGMLSIDVPKGSQFDLVIKWDIKGKPYELTIHDIKCVK